jgi:hypothetical protein
MSFCFRNWVGREYAPNHPAKIKTGKWLMALLFTRLGSL